MSGSSTSNSVPQETTDTQKNALRDVPPKATMAPEDDDFFRTFRRFTDQHISSMMQSFFGLPTVFSPPPSSGWMVFEEGSDGSWRRPEASRVLSEIQQKKEGSEGRSSVEGDSDAEKRVRPARFYILRDPFGFGPEFSRVAGMNSFFGPSTVVPLPPQSVLDYPASRDAFFQHVKNHIINDPFFNPGLGADSFFNKDPFLSPFPVHRSPFFAHPAFWGLGAGHAHHRSPWDFPPPSARRVIKDAKDKDTEHHEDSSDLFKQLGFSDNGENTSSESANSSGKRIVSTSASTISTLGEDGVMHTKYALRKRYSDGTEEVVEREYDDQGHNPAALLRDGEQKWRELTKESEEQVRKWAHEGERAWKLVWDKGKEVLEELKKGPGGEGGR